MSSIVGIDLFCGAGGVTCGFKKAGIDMRLGVDSDSAFKKTYEVNNKSNFLCADIRFLCAEKIIEEARLVPRGNLIVSSCAPCQPFSLQNNKNKNEFDYRKDLGYELIRILKELKNRNIVPQVLFMENVPEFEKSPVWKEIDLELHRMRYSIVSKVINCAGYGIPQNRKRFIALARLGYDHFSFPGETHGPGKHPFLTVRDAFTGLKRLKAGMACKNVPNHQTRALSPLNLKRISSVPKDGGSRTSFPEELVLQCHKKFGGHKDVYGRMKSDEPSPTITTRCVSITNGRFGHPVEDRGISLREAARLQTFSDEFIFYGNNLEKNSKMIGNAVPVKCAEIFGGFIKEKLFSG